LLFVSASFMIRVATWRTFRSLPFSGATTMVMSFLLSSHFHEIISSVGSIFLGVVSGLWNFLQAAMAFWQRVERVMPDYAQRKTWLAEHGMEVEGL
jgi:hypothetical protein